MPTIEFASKSPTSAKADTLVVFATKGGDGPVPGADAEALGHELGIDMAADLAAVRFTGDLGEVARIPTRGKARAQVALVVGAGETARVTLEALRRAAGAAARNAAKEAAVALVVPGDLAAEATDADRARAVAEGAGLGAYAFTAYRTKTDDLPSLTGIVICAGQGMATGEVKKAVTEAQILVRAQCIARDLVNEPPGAKRPPDLADRVANLAKDAGLRVKIHDEQALEQGRFGGILGVGQGSAAPPRLVELTHDPLRARGHVVLVGKGITFDSGGLSLKPATAMTTMKCDMAGAAAIVGAMLAVAELGLKTTVTALLAMAENMPSATSYRVGDVLTHRGGTTVEVLNTDAEGRLVLGDALAYAAEREPDAVVDVATLTGAQEVALGKSVSAVLGTDDTVVEQLLAAASATGEGLWRLPLVDDYREHLKSEVADLKNIGKRGQAGTIVAGLFLREFVGGRPWAHLDIAGPAFSDDGDAFYTPKGGTGVLARTLVRFLQDRAG